MKLNSKIIGIYIIIGICITFLLGTLMSSYQEKAPCKKTCEQLGTANPAAVYCKALGYSYKIVKTEEGEKGICKFPDGSECDAWDFLSGKCGQKWSYCERTGGKLVTNGKCSISQTCAVCILPNGKRCFEWDYCNGRCS